jgi:microcompartment protein CcmL/EutN
VISLAQGPLESLALLELDSIARGYRVVDALVKEAPVAVKHANLVEPGKFLILFGGGVGETLAAFEVGVRVAKDTLHDSLHLPLVEPRIWSGLHGATGAGEIDTLGIVESRSIASTLAACDASLKMAAVDLVGLRVAVGLGGRGYFVVSGLQHDVEAAVTTGEHVLTARSKLHRVELVANPHPEFLAHLLAPAPFGYT